jgi:hypothetical protein
MIQGLGFRVQGLGFGDFDFGFMDYGPWLRFRAYGLGFRVWN